MGGFVPKEELDKARSMDLLTYKMNFEPWDLKKIKDGWYQLVSHDSLKINFNNGKWLWFQHSTGIGGRSAMDYLMKVENMSLQDACATILGRTVAVEKPLERPQAPSEPKAQLVIPELEQNDDAIYKYLCDERGIDKEIVKHFVENTEIYLTKQYKNIAFVGTDEKGEIKLVALRGTKGNFKNTTAGSDRKYPFQVRSEDFGVKNNVVHLFEAPIDLLSYATLMKQMGIDFKTQNMIALCGIYMPAKDMGNSKIPVGLMQHFKEVPYTKTVCLHLDSDGPGVLAARALQMVLEKEGYKVLNQPPPQGFKDCNEFLLRGSNAFSNNKDREVVKDE